MSWEAKIHIADEEYGTTAYNEVSVTNVSALTGHIEHTLNVLSVDEEPTIEGGSEQYADGSIQPSRAMRYKYTLRTEPVLFSSRDTATKNLKEIIVAPYTWLELNTTSQDSAHNVGTTDTYHTTDYCIPVTLTELTTEHSHESGRKSATLVFLRRFRPQ